MNKVSGVETGSTEETPQLLTRKDRLMYTYVPTTAAVTRGTEREAAATSVSWA